MDTVTYPDPRVAEFVSRHFVPVQLPVKEHRDLVEEYLVSWTPNVILADDRGRPHDRVEGYLPPEDFLAELALGLGKFLLNRKQFADAAERFEGVVERHPGTEARAEALYWLGVALYKGSHDAALLRPSWQRLTREHPASGWATRTKVPGMG
jgi:hypothetical protein